MMIAAIKVPRMSRPQLICAIVRLRQYLLQQCFEFIDCQTGLTNDSSERSFGYFFVVRNSNATMRIRTLSENNMTAALSILFVPAPSQGFTTSLPETRGRTLTPQPLLTPQ